MGRSRSRSYSPRSRSPGPRRRRYADDPPMRRGDREWRRSPPCSLLVRNIPREARPEEVRVPFEKFGPVKDVYLPKDYYSGEPRGFGFVQFIEPGDAADAKFNMDHQLLGGREITVVFAEENRKKPSEMRIKTSRSGSWSSGRYGGGYRRSPPRSPRRYRSRSRSRSPRPRRYHSSRDAHERYGRSPSPHHHHHQNNIRSPSPRRETRSRHRPSPGISDRGPSPSPQGNGHGSRRSLSRSPSPVMAARRYSRSFSRD
ncbi:serine/arginine-rich SC35-like splicing factor SCL28 isoform X2 [Selaginella moellendorffii]|uniref:serine/arginine-rich SC35-like splicing factor SCL28 n=1 Tax=Selaginella moellendorffii TaxID=88036 RepID=UPI000D1C629A|nr:serine/arginine-rich SC35-like splicing factor SCL28 [Selaginella moellendorffii]XP_024542310.1 serine/arginine-rich SC35-like splicing factor SCL28 isoform X2 [Selaginella moellendorffii]|eukprot:XP_002963579.2 serine/arginine-rich SC35-like splicing factor SCL28 [Selaginella moellendorffii]